MKKQFNHNFRLSNLLFTLTLTLFIFSNLICSNITYAISESDYSRPITDISESQFNKMVDEISKKELKRVSHVIDIHDQRKGIDKAREIVVSKLKHVLPFNKMKQMIISKGLPVAAISVVGELVTTLLMPPLLTALNMPYLAVLSAAIPSPTYLLPPYFYLVNQGNQKKIAKELNIELRDLKKLDELRKQLLVFNKDNRIINFVYEELEKSPEFTVIKKDLLKGWYDRVKKVKLPPGFIDLATLESIIKNNYSKETLSLLKEASQMDDAVYTMLLVNYLKSGSNPTGKQALEAYLRSKITSLSANQVPILNKNLLNIEKEKKLVDLTIVQYKKLIALKQKELKTLVVNQARVESEIAQLKNAIKELAILSKDIDVFEYQYLSLIDSVDQSATATTLVGKTEKSSWKSITERYNDATKRYPISGYMTGCLKQIHESL